MNYHKSATRRKSGLFVFGLYHLTLISFCVLCILPLLLTVSISLSGEDTLIKEGYSLIPRVFSLEAYEIVFEHPAQLIFSYLVTILVALSGTSFGLLITTMLAYVLSRKDYPFSNKTSFYVFFTMLFSGGMVPWYILISNTLHMRDTIFALIIPYLIIPWHVLLMKGFLSEIPASLIESAKIDGASEYRIFFSMVVPISKVGMTTVGLFTLLMYWNDYYLSLMFIQNSKIVSLQFLLYRIMSNIDFLNSSLAASSGVTIAAKDMPNLSARMALCLLAAGPMLFVFAFFQKYFVSGITVGAVKG